MRVLFTICSEKSFFLAAAPLAWALRTAGHEVRVASQPKLTETVTQAGLTAVPVGKDHGIWRTLELRPELRQSERIGLPKPYAAAEMRADEVSWDYLREAYNWTVTWWHKMENVPVMADLVAFAQHWQPDLVIWEPTSYAGAIAAKTVGAAHARLLWGMDVFGITRAHYLRLQRERPAEDRADPLADWLGANAARYGGEYSEDLATGHFSLDQLPPSLRIQADLNYLPMRYIPYGGAAVVPKWLQTPPERPRVALTLGIAAVDCFGGYSVSVQDILDAVADLDLELVATIAPEEQRKLRHIPDNARVLSYVPLHALVPTCSAVIHHAGFGTLATTTLHGVPQLTLPVHFDEPALSARLTAQGTGLTVHSDQASGQLVRENLLRLLTEPTFRAGAARLRAEMLAMPTPNEVVGQLEELTLKHRTPVPIC